MSVLEEPLHPLPVAVERVTGKRPHYSTPFRWTQAGLLTPDGRRVRLEFAKAGGKRMTSEDAVRRFVAAATAAFAGEPIPTRTYRQREAEIARAERDLEEQGF